MMARFMIIWGNPPLPSLSRLAEAKAVALLLFKGSTAVDEKKPVRTHLVKFSFQEPFSFLYIAACCQV